MTGRFISTIAGIALIVTRCVFAGKELRVMHYKKSGKWELEVNGQCKAFVTKFTSGSSSSPNPEAISFIKDAECNDDRSGMKETPISSLTDKSPLKKMISSFGMSESSIPPLTFTTHDISFYKIETNDGGIGLKVSGTMDVTQNKDTRSQNKDTRSNLKETLASLKEQVLRTSVVAGSAHFLRFMHQKHRASRIRRLRYIYAEYEVGAFLLVVFFALLVTMMYRRWHFTFASLIGDFEDVAGRARPATGDLELGNVNDGPQVVPDVDVRDYRTAFEIIFDCIQDRKSVV